MFQKITVQHLAKPVDKDTRDDVFWLCDSFHFNTGRDVDRISSRTIFHFLKHFAEAGPTSTEDLADDLNISPARVNYHIRNLIDSGFLFRNRRLISLRAGSLKSAVEEMRKDANRIFDELTLVAEEVDSALGMKNR